MHRPAVRVLSAALLLISVSAQADKPGFGDTFKFSAGGMSTTADATLSYTIEGFPEIDLDLSDLGIDDSSTELWLGTKWQFADNWSLGASYSKFSSDGTNVISRDGNFGAVDYTAGATLSADIDIKLYIVDLTWDFVNTGKANFGIGLGLHIADLSAQLGATIIGSVSGAPPTTIVDFGTDSAEVTAPLPNVTLAGGIMLGEKVYLTGKGGYFSLNYDKYDGELLSVSGGIEWRPFKNFGIGAGYQYVNMNLKVDESSSDKKYDVDLYGPVIFLSAGF